MLFVLMWPAVSNLLEDTEPKLPPNRYNRERLVHFSVLSTGSALDTSLKLSPFSFRTSKSRKPEDPAKITQPNKGLSSDWRSKFKPLQRNDLSGAATKPTAKRTDKTGKTGKKKAKNDAQQSSDSEQDALRVVETSVEDEKVESVRGKGVKLEVSCSSTLMPSRYSTDVPVAAQY